ncbi:FAD-dependent oxidoreductase [Paenibacillus segetis]|uniref:Pyridine nucleotide-disulfide oxidoreductase n=1 Tax=Paenibacillus segetis TaxID=1325360 RepID=A0ABQ1YDT8_9BACL|nr:FAD-dependent oxidoreductase [Paenibacillus segetis]GGH21731.1 pyridine nucleotide-disulfide oxidoreductase [Paenibacillus segetis]
MKNYDAIIIGFGKAGKTLAADLANHGNKVALIEQSKYMYGGTCINVGCLPTKSLVNSSKISQYKQFKTFEQKSQFYKEAIADKNKLTANLRTKNFDKLNDHPNVVIYTGKASFVSSYEVKVEMEQETIHLFGTQIFINTGSKAIIPDIEGIHDNKRVYLSDSLLDVTKLPARLSIIGGGYIGLEFASIYANFGSKVTVFQDTANFLPREDDELAAEVKQVMMEQGIVFKLGVITTSLSDNGTEAILHYKDAQSGENMQYPADAILLATGRKPNTEELNLAAARIVTTPKGAVKVDELLRTNIPNIWAMGDVVGGLQFTYVSLDDYRIVREQLLGNGERSTDKRNIPYSVFIDPAFSRVGLSEKEAKEQGFDVKVAKLSVAAIPKAQVIQEPKGMLKAVIDGKTDQILGVTLFCPESYEMINIVKIAMDAGLPYTFLKNQIFTHPTFSEALNDLFGAIQ